MAEKIGDVLVFRSTASDLGTCELCSTYGDLRPYGPGGKRVCVECFSKDLKASRERMLSYIAKQLEGVNKQGRYQ